ncbi:hypothetical protein AtubIFM54640_003884 [Aspergillus tubingensis]|nr:hypothetical protein AtubIFM54640_003884 [Aspergillus tubingensis]
MAAHPLQALGEAVGAAGADPRIKQLNSLFQGANDGPARTAAKLTGVQQGGKREDDGPYFTNNEGIPFPDPAHSKTAGGLPLVSDTFLLQKQQHFNRSKNLERMVHPCGSGAFGYFETTRDVSNLTKADFLKSSGLKTPVFVRFSTVTLGREFPDLARNPRGFAIKFYTGEGNYDIVGLNFPVFFCRDPIQGPDVIRSQSRNPQNFLLDHNSLFDLLANTPEGKDACYVADKNPENFHRDVEQAAFSPGSMVPGIEDSPDPLLQFRMFFYRDAQYHRIGINLHQVPVNCPFMASSYSSLNFDGQMRVDANHGMNPQYVPNSFVNKFRPDVAEAPYQLADNNVGRKSHFYHEGKPSEYDRSRALYKQVMDERARKQLHDNTARLLRLVEYPLIQIKYLAQLYRIAPEYAKGVYDLLPEKPCAFSEVEQRAGGAEAAMKEPKFRPCAPTDKLVGTCPMQPIYNVQV